MIHIFGDQFFGSPTHLQTTACDISYAQGSEQVMPLLALLEGESLARTGA